MAYVVCEPCQDCKYTDCVVVCPCDCFYQDGSMLYIDPDDCIHCGACTPECPVDAIFPDIQVPERWTQFVDLNTIRSHEIRNQEGPIVEKQEALLGAGCRRPRT